VREERELPISFECPQCGRKLKAPEESAGKRCKCPGCGAKVICPQPSQKVEATKKPTTPASPIQPLAGEPHPDLDDGSPYALQDPDPTPIQESSDERRPCPECGELIKATAAKCKHCGKVLDAAALAAKRKKSGSKGRSGLNLRKIAISQKGILVCMPVQILLYIAFLMTPWQWKLIPALPLIVAGLLGMVFTLMLAIELYSVGLGILLGLLALLPIIGLLVLFILSSKGMNVLKEHGHSVGFMGADLSEF
jgi:DNA-directed RNA polymerase subunit RPC12/RpoP